MHDPFDRLRRGAFCLLLVASGLGAACSGDDEAGQPREATSTELVGLVRSNAVGIAMGQVRSGKAFETSKAWSDAEAPPIDCELEAGAARSCQAEVEAWADELVAELFPASAIVETTPTRTTWAETIELGMTPYRIEWSLLSPAPDAVVAELRLGGETRVAATIRLSSTSVSVEADLAAFATLLEMSEVMDELEDADLIESLSGVVGWSLELTGPRALEASVELRDFGFTLSFMDGEQVVLSSSGAFRVTAGQDGDNRRASLALDLPAVALTLPAHLVQDEGLTRCELPSDPCRPRADETLSLAIASARLEAATVADSGELDLAWTGPTDAWLTVTADEAELARAELGGFEAGIQTASEELLVELSDVLRAELAFDLSPLTDAFDFALVRERLSLRFQGRASVPTRSSGGDPEGVLRVLSGSLSAEAQEVGDTLQVEAGQCLLAYEQPQRGLSEDHPFAFLGAGVCPR